MTVVLAYEGVPSQRQEAEAKLRSAVPGIVLTRKTSNIVEAQVEASDVEQLIRSGVWRIVTPVFADIKKPAYDLSRLRAQFGSKK